MRFIPRAFFALFRYLWALAVPSRAFRALYAELARLDYVNEWREFRTLAGTAFGITSSMGGPKLRAVGIEPFYFRQRERGKPTERLVIETISGRAAAGDVLGAAWDDHAVGAKEVRLERRLLAEIYAFSPCIASDENNVIPRVVS